jgi:uncharacterized protein (TIGR03437 family)
VVRRNIANGAVTYAGFLNAQQAWLTGQDQMVAQAAYVGLPPFAVLPAGNPPAGTVTCMASAAVYDNSWIAPGEILSVFGNAIGPTQAFPTELDANGNVSKSLGGMTVSVGGLSAPILYTDPGQINLVAPFGIPTSGTAHVEIQRNGLTVAAFDAPVAETHAALFAADGSGFGPLAALNQDGSVNSARNPAAPGSIVTVFGTGFGTMVPPALDGAAPCTAVSKPVATLPLFLNYTTGGPPLSAPAIFEYIGNAPCQVQGAVQINLRLLDGVRPVDGVVSLSYGFGYPGTIAVQ